MHMDSRVPSSFGTTLGLAGAVLAGWGLHATVVTGQAAITDPQPLLALVSGALLSVAGARIHTRFDPSAYVTPPEDSDAEFDEERSPVQEEWLDGRERDDPHDR